MSTSATGSMSALSRDGALDQRFALDVQGVDKLRLTTRTSPQEGLKQVSRQFEAMFMSMVLKSMRDATPSDGPMDSDQQKMFTSMLDQQLAQSLSGRGLGLAEAMQAQLQRSVNPAQDDGAAPVIKLLNPPAQPFDLTHHGLPLPPAATPAVTPNLSFYDAASGNSARTGSSTSQAQIDQFVARMGAPAQAASVASGMPAQLILAQAALESGWGQREIKDDSGNQSYNLFGIKAGKNWKGPVVQANTTEYVNGVAHSTKATFRAYGSYQEAFTDYGKFLTGNPRYAQALAAGDPVEAAYGLQRAGYATDPQYGGKLARIMKQIA